ncbi:MAG: prepilin-type N-terminal cleavage/methylation domain-containing protein [Acidobacteriota bacterium]
MRSGITLVEMLIVVAIVGLLAGITFPSVSAGLDSLRLTTAGDSLVSLFNAALNRAERRQQVVEVAISRNLVTLRSTEPGFSRALELPDGVSITAIHPEGQQRFLLFPGGSVPRVAVELSNRRGARRLVSLNPITGVPQVERIETK